jgi:hypothetical protein
MNMKKPRTMKMMDSAKPEGMAMPRFGARAMRPGGMAKGGKVHEDAAMDKKLIRKEIMRAEKMEDKNEAKGMKKGGGVMPAKDPASKDLMAIKDTPIGRKMAGAAMGAKKMAKGGGVEFKGKTKGRFV